MNCQDIALILDDQQVQKLSDTDKEAVNAHLAGCTDCADEWHVHTWQLSAGVPPMPTDLPQNVWNSLPPQEPSGRSVRRSGPALRLIVLVLFGTAVAAFIASNWINSEPDGKVALDSAQESTLGPVLPLTTAIASSMTDSATEVEGDDPSLAVPETEPARFTVELTRLVQIDETPLSRQFGDWFHAALVEELTQVPNLELIEVAFEVEIPTIPVLPNVDASAREFRFDTDTSTWPANYDIRLAVGAGTGNDWAGSRWVAVSSDGRRDGLSSDPHAMRPIVEAVPEYAASEAAEIVEQLQISLFPADAAFLTRKFAEFEAVAMDMSVEISQRNAALFAAEEVAQRADDPELTTRLVDATLALAGQIEDALLNSSNFSRYASQASPEELASARAEFAGAPAGILTMLSNIGDARMIEPLSNMLLYDQNDATRLAAATVLGDFVDDPLARTALEWAVTSDSSADVRKAASDYLLDDVVHLEGIFNDVRASDLPDNERLNTFLLYDERWQFVEPGFSVNDDTVSAIAEIIRRSVAPVRREALEILNGRSQSTSFVPVYLERLRNDSSADVRADMPEILGEYFSQPGVEEALRKAAADDSSAEVRAAAARILKENDR